MSQQTINFISEFMVEGLVALCFYFFGVLTSIIIGQIKKNSFEKKFHDQAVLAVNLIYEAEENFQGDGRGLEKLEYVTKKFTNVYKKMGYERSQDFIMKMFNLTKLSK